MAVKTKQEARQNFESALPNIPSRYETGVKKANWFDPATSDTAEQNFKTAMSTVISQELRRKGIRAKWDNKSWQDAAVNKGGPIIQDRIRSALDKWQKVWGDMYDQITSLLETLPAKTTDPMRNIDQRLKPVVSKWVDLKKARVTG